MGKAPLRAVPRSARGRCLATRDAGAPSCPYRKPKSASIMKLIVEFQAVRKFCAVLIRSRSTRIRRSLAVAAQHDHGRVARVTGVLQREPRAFGSERADESQQMQDEVHAGASRAALGGATYSCAVESKTRTVSAESELE